MKAGGITSRLSGDIDSVGGLVQMAVISPAVAPLRVIATLGILLCLSPRLACAVAALSAAAGGGQLPLVASGCGRSIARCARTARRSTAASTETFGGIRVVRAFRREPREERGYAVGHHTDHPQEPLRRAAGAGPRSRLGPADPGDQPADRLVRRLARACAARRRSATSSRSRSTPCCCCSPIWQIVTSVSQTQKSLAAMERVFEVLEMPPDKPDAPDAVDAPRRRGRDPLRPRRASSIARACRCISDVRSDRARRLDGRAGRPQRRRARRR